MFNRYWATVFTVDYLGRRNIQLMGFTVMTALMAALAGGYFHLLNPNTHHAMGLSKEQPDKKNGWITMYESSLESVNYVCCNI